MKVKIGTKIINFDHVSEIDFYYYDYPIGPEPPFSAGDRMPQPRYDVSIVFSDGRSLQFSDREAEAIRNSDVIAQWVDHDIVL